MAQKQKQKQRPSPHDDPPSASSSDSQVEEDQQPSPQYHHAHYEEEEEEEEEENVPPSEEENEEEEEEEEEEEDDEEEEEQQQQQQDLQSIPLKSPPTNSHSQSDSGSHTQSDSLPPKVKPLASKPMGPAQIPKPKSGSKRAVESVAQASDPKRAKKKVTSDCPASDEDDGKKKAQRLWSDDDQLAVLKGVVEFTSSTGQDPLKYADAFHASIKDSLHVDVSSNQLKEKIRRLKKKFEANAQKLKNNGEALKFPKPHDQKAFELSKKVWGSEQQAPNGAAEKPKANGKIAKTPKKEGGGGGGGGGGSRNNVASVKKLKPEAEPEVAPENEMACVAANEGEKVGVEGRLVLSEMCRFRSLHGLNEEETKRGLELIGESKRAHLEERWKKLRDAETELFANRAILTGEHTKIIFDALQSSNR